MMMRIFGSTALFDHWELPSSFFMIQSFAVLRRLLVVCGDHMAFPSIRNSSTNRAVHAAFMGPDPVNR